MRLPLRLFNFSKAKSENGGDGGDFFNMFLLRCVMGDCGGGYVLR